VPVRLYGATRLAWENGENIYDDAHYKMPAGGPRYMVRRDTLTETYDDARMRALFTGGRVPRVAVVHVDQYEYPPPFLLSCLTQLVRLSSMIFSDPGECGSSCRRSYCGQGRKPFVDFVWYQVLAIGSGAAFGFNEPTTMDSYELRCVWARCESCVCSDLIS
jgi:hypothetical protein